MYGLGNALAENECSISRAILRRWITVTGKQTKISRLVAWFREERLGDSQTVICVMVCGIPSYRRTCMAESKAGLRDRPSTKAVAQCQAVLRSR